MKILLAYYVLSAISNDYEDLEMVSQEVLKWTAEDNLDVRHDQIVETLHLLIASGYAYAYIKRSGSSSPERVDFSPQCAHTYYFLVTEAGKRLVKDLDALS